MSNELTVVQRAQQALRTADHEPALVELAKSTADIVEIKNADGRTQAHSAYMSLKTRRTDIRKVGKAARDDATQFSKAVIAEEDRLVGIIEPEETRLQALRDAWDAAREAERVAKVEAEKQRKAALTKKVSDLREIPLNFVDASSDKIQTAIDDLEAFEVTEAEFAELIDAAHLARKEVLNKLFDMRVAASAREIEAHRIAAERELLAQQRAEQEERQRQADAARAEQDRIDNERRDALAAEQRAQQEAADRMTAAMSEIQGIQQQVIIATMGRAGVRKGGTVECIRDTLSETEAWTIDAERFGMLVGAATVAKESAITEIRRLLVDAERKQAEADEAAAHQRAADEAAAAEQREREAAAERERATQAEREEAARIARIAGELPADALGMLDAVLYMIAEPVGQECCGRTGYECCGEAVPVYRNADEIAAELNAWREALIARQPVEHKEAA